MNGTMEPAGAAAAGETSLRAFLSRGRGWTCERRDLLTAAALALLWIAFAYRHLTAPWLWGVDPYTRIYHIDEPIVVVNGNAWLPLLQIFLMGVHAISSTVLAFKLAMTLVSALGMFFFFLVVARLLCYSTAVFASSYFFLHSYWQIVATSLYMEPLLLLTVSLAAWLHLRKRRAFAAVFVVLATFSRPEVLMAAPVLLAAHLAYFRRWKRTLRLALLFVPVVLFFVGARIWVPGFEVSGEISRKMVAERLAEIVYLFRNSVPFGVAGVLALLGAATALFDRKLRPEQRKGLRLLAAGIVAFALVFSMALPAAYGFRPRFSIQFLLPVFVLAGVGCSYLARVKPAVVALVLLAAVLAVAVWDYRKERLIPSPVSRAASRILRQMEKMGYTRKSTVYICRLDKGKSGDDWVKHIDQMALVGASVRLDGWPIEEIPCFPGDESWKRIEAARKGPLLRVYKADLIDEDYEKELLAGCRYFTKIWNRRRIDASICL